MATNVYGPSFVGGVVGDIDGLMSPKARLMARWRGSERRVAARRGLRTLLSVYFPDLLVEFEEAIDARADFVSRHSDLPGVIGRMTNAELADVQQEARATQSALVSVTDRLADLVVELFPVDPNTAK